MESAPILALIRDLAFPRFCGSEGERRAQELIAERLVFAALAERPALRRVRTKKVGRTGAPNWLPTRIAPAPGVTRERR